MRNFLRFILLIIIALTGCNNGTSDHETEETETLVPVEEEAFAFPGAEGFGKNTTGGRGGKILIVTNLNNAGPGSLRFALESSGARYIIFKVSGTIELSSELKITNGDVTIAGQTAPGDGICLKNYPVTVASDNIIIRYIRFRMGDEAKQEGDALGGRFCKNLIVDHCSMSWSTDECVSFYANENTTVQWSIVSESLRNSVHFKGAHGYGGIWGGKNASFHHNLLAHHDSRNPRLGETAGTTFALTDLVDLRNNVIYNWGQNSCYGGEAMNVNIVNCYYKPGPATANDSRIVSIDKNKYEDKDIYDVWGKFYIDGNYIEGSDAATGDNWTYGVFNQFSSDYGEVSDSAKVGMQLEQPLNISGNVTTHVAKLAYDRVLNWAGASLKRDAVDARIIHDVKSGTYTHEGSNGSTNGIIDSQNDVGGWPELQSEEYPEDTDNDGMPDEWEESVGLDPQVKDGIGHELSTGYDNLEVYMNQLVEEITQKQNE